MSLPGLLRTDAEIWRASPAVGETGEVEANYALLGSARCAVQRPRGGTARGSAGELVEVELVAYFRPGTDIRPELPGEMPDRVRLDGCDYVCVFVDRSFGRHAPVRAGLKGVS